MGQKIRFDGANKVRYKVIIPPVAGAEVPEKPIQAFVDTEPGVRQLVEQYLGMLPPGRQANVFEIVSIPLFTVTSSMEETSKGKPVMQFTETKIERGKNEQAVS